VVDADMDIVLRTTHALVKKDTLVLTALNSLAKVQDVFMVNALLLVSALAMSIYFHLKFYFI
jgi:hypothetical protein